MGITEEKLQELNNYKSSSLFSSKEQAILRYADAMTSTPVEIPDEIFQEISKYFNESQICFLKLPSTICIPSKLQMNWKAASFRSLVPMSAAL